MHASRALKLDSSQSLGVFQLPARKFSSGGFDWNSARLVVSVSKVHSIGMKFSFCSQHPRTMYFGSSFSKPKIETHRGYIEDARLASISRTLHSIEQNFSGTSFAARIRYQGHMPPETSSIDEILNIRSVWLECFKSTYILYTLVNMYPGGSHIDFGVYIYFTFV